MKIHQVVNNSDPDG